MQCRAVPRASAPGAAGEVRFSGTDTNEVRREEVVRWGRSGGGERWSTRRCRQTKGVEERRMGGAQTKRTRYRE